MLRFLRIKIETIPQIAINRKNFPVQFHRDYESSKRFDTIR